MAVILSQTEKFYTVSSTQSNIQIVFLVEGEGALCNVFRFFLVSIPVLRGLVKEILLREEKAYFNHLLILITNPINHQMVFIPTFIIPRGGS